MNCKVKSSEENSLKLLYFMINAVSNGKHPVEFIKFKENFKIAFSQIFSLFNHDCPTTTTATSVFFN